MRSSGKSTSILTVLKSTNVRLGKNTGLLLGTLVLFVFFSIFGERFFSAYNLTNVLRNSAVLMIASIGTTMTILSGHNDLSVGSVMSLSGAAAGLLMIAGVNTVIAIIAGILTGVVCGLINGYLIAYIKADFWIVTFAMMSIAQGLTLVLTEGRTKSGFSGAFRFIGSGELFSIDFGDRDIFTIGCLMVFTIIVVIVMLNVLKKTRFGYNVYAVGDSETCAMLSGIKIKRVKLGIFTLGGAFAGVAGIMLTARDNSVMPTGGAPYTFDAIAAVLVGGTAFGGGRGGYAGTVIGAFLIMMIRNGLSMMGVPTLWQYVMIGLIILAVIIYDTVKTRITLVRESRRRYPDA